MVHNRLWTADRLEARGWPHQDRCVFVIRLLNLPSISSWDAPTLKIFGSRWRQHTQPLVELQADPPLPQGGGRKSWYSEEKKKERSNIHCGLWDVALVVVTQHTTACCSIQVVDITLVKYQFINITSLRVVQQKHSGLYSNTEYYKP
jgi:hypothetical protein